VNAGPGLTLVVTLLAVLCGVIGLLVVTQLRARRRDTQILGLLATFGPVAERARSDPRVLLAWYPTAEAARRIFPDAFEAIDQNGTDRFPFDAAQLEAAHARWTTDWLEWERNHDSEYRQRSEAIEAELDRSVGVASKAARDRLEILEREKLERYQRRYEEYVRISRALANLTDTTGDTDAGLRGAD
jgi:hypothetical protein